MPVWREKVFNSESMRMPFPVIMTTVSSRAGVTWACGMEPERKRAAVSKKVFIRLFIIIRLIASFTAQVKNAVFLFIGKIQRSCNDVQDVGERFMVKLRGHPAAAQSRVVQFQ